MMQATCEYIPPAPCNGTYNLLLRGLTGDEVACLRALAGRHGSTARLIYTHAAGRACLLADVLSAIFRALPREEEEDS